MSNHGDSSACDIIFLTLKISQLCLPSPFPHPNGRAILPETTLPPHCCMMALGHRKRESKRGSSPEVVLQEHVVMGQGLCHFQQRYEVARLPAHLPAHTSHHVVAFHVLDVNRSRTISLIQVCKVRDKLENVVPNPVEAQCYWLPFCCSSAWCSSARRQRGEGGGRGKYLPGLFLGLLLSSGSVISGAGSGTLPGFSTKCRYILAFLRNGSSVTSAEFSTKVCTCRCSSHVITPLPVTVTHLWSSDCLLSFFFFF